jgi:hypothetical protein
MKILSLEMNNFQPYKGQQTVSFPTDPTRKIMLVFGDNMRGNLDTDGWSLLFVAFQFRKGLLDDLATVLIRNVLLPTCVGPNKKIRASGSAE